MPDWTDIRPSVMDIVTTYFPETKPKGKLQLRPCLVTKVLRNRVSGQIACEVAYGTKNLQTWSKHDHDVIVQNTSDLDAMGLPVATRFVLDDHSRAILPWIEKHFGCWTGHVSPKIGALLIDYQKDYAFAMMKRMSK